MGFVDEITKITPKDPGPPCGVATVLNALNTQEQDALNAVLFAQPRTVSNVGLQKFLINKGFDVSKSSVTLHRRKDCKCFIGKAQRMSVGS